MILLTGASGFIGKHLLNSLILNYGKENVIALTSQPISSCNYILHHDYFFDKNYFIDKGFNNIHTIIHAGAFTPKNTKESNYLNQSNSNIFNTTKLISSSIPNLKKIIFLSTLDVYASSATAINENSIIDPISLYAQSKLYCEKLLESWSSDKKINLQILRIGHVYGPGEEKYKKIIPITINNILSDKPITIYGEGKAIRSFIYVSDIVDAIINALELNNNIDCINIVGDEQISIKDLVEKLIKISKKEITIKFIKTNASERNLIFDNNKMKMQLHIPIINLEEGLIKEFNYMSKLLK